MVRAFLPGVMMLLAVQPRSAAQVGNVPKASDVVTWHAQVLPSDVARNGEAALVIRAELDEGWSSYAMGSPAGRPLSVDVSAVPDGVRVSGEPEQSGAERAFDPNFDSDVLYVRPATRVRVPLMVGRNAAPGEHDVEGSLTFMACNDRMCLPPTTVTFEASLRILQAPP